MQHVLSPLLLTQPGWAILREYWPVGAISVVVALAATPICRAAALRWKFVDRPDDFLKPHGRPIPYLGGVAICAGWLAGIAAALCIDPGGVRPGLMLGIALAGLVTMLVGLFDDLRVMPPKVKLACNVLVAAMLLLLGLGDDIIQVTIAVTGSRLSPEERWLELAYSVPITVFIVVGASNATNVIDGLDGLCAGVLGIISLGFLVLACHLRGFLDSPAATERVVLALAMLGGAAGFLPYNLNPARIFMGDAGSMLLGLNAAVLLLLFAEEQKIRWMMGAVMVFGLPVGDMLLAMVRRWRNGRPLMQGDRSHFYDQLVDRGLTVRQTVAVSYLLATFMVLVGVSVIVVRTRHSFLVFGFAVALLFALAWKYNMAGIEPDRRPETRGDRPAGAGEEVGA